ncbi:hypothetical protein KM043_007709 [Ampulex compressa]|nr:hypothetical protein KM043_007709 [Ampulex compressa]
MQLCFSRSIYPCYTCGKTYKWKESLNLHKRMECGIEPRFPCKICGRSRVPLQSLRQDLCQEVLDVHPPAALRQRAEVQLRPVRQEVQVQAQAAVAPHLEFARSALSITIEIVQRVTLPTDLSLRHVEAARLNCEENNSAIVRSLSFVSDLWPRKLFGPFCGVPKWTSSSIEVYLQKTWVCLQCGKRYLWRGSLKNHIRVECGKEPTFKCPICGRKFKHKHRWQSHAKCMHRINL